MAEEFRRNFDAEAVATARGKRPRAFSAGGMPQIEAPSLPENRTIITARRPELLDGIIKAAKLGEHDHTIVTFDLFGEDWRITTPTRQQTDRVLAFLKTKGAHGVIRVKRA